jgi:hypothetical protein
MAMASVGLLVSSSAFAQDGEASGEVTVRSTPAVTVSGSAGANGPGAGGGGEGRGDHDRAVHHFGVTYFGVKEIPSSDDAGKRTNVDAPVIGVRYWLNEKIGIDGGLGLGWGGFQTEASRGGTTLSVKGPNYFGMMLHGGVPIALSEGRHYVFEVIPEVNLGFASGTSPSPDTNSGERKLGGFKLDLGARVGSEIHFGFMGVPQLALQASVGLFLTTETWSRTFTENNAENKVSGTQTRVGTTLHGEPWSIFTNNLAAIYYF